MPPPIISTRITSAPNCASVRPASGAAMNAELSITRSRFSRSYVMLRRPSQALSKIAAMPWPPPMHIVSKP